jgi:hypothetical protein
MYEVEAHAREYDNGWAGAAALVCRNLHIWPPCIPTFAPRWYQSQASETATGGVRRRRQLGPLTDWLNWMGCVLLQLCSTRTDAPVPRCELLQAPKPGLRVETAATASTASSESRMTTRCARNAIGDLTSDNRGPRSRWSAGLRNATLPDKKQPKAQRRRSYAPSALSPRSRLPGERRVARRFRRAGAGARGRRFRPGARASSLALRPAERRRAGSGNECAAEAGRRPRHQGLVHEDHDAQRGCGRPSANRIHCCATPAAPGRGYADGVPQGLNSPFGMALVGNDLYVACRCDFALSLHSGRDADHAAGREDRRCPRARSITTGPRT